jgi:class 3 adenylate cyclase/tetratricopeptide (TPR) repeat protein
VSTPVAERRVCSVLFCDLVGFTPLSEVRDPEEVRELLSGYFEVARTVVGRYGGVVEKFIGDAVMAVWGTPSATEQDGERAVRAGLDLVDAVAALGRDAGVSGLAARAGVVTGPVAVSVGASGEGMVAGDAVNTAARVQAAAGPGAVLVDEGTRRVADAAVGFVSAGEHVLKGKAGAVVLWRAVRVLSGVGGSQRIDGLEAPFVGRDAELRLVKDLFHACVDRRSPRLVSVTGAAGVGKSRLGWEFEKYVDGLADTVWWHRGRCLSYGDGVAFWALAEMVRQRFQVAEEDSAAVAAEKLVSGLEGFVGDPVERAYVGSRLAQLLGVEYGEPGPVLGREELFAGWRLFFERLAGQGPVVLVVEDLHYADSGLLDFVEHVLDWARDVPIFVLTLARPELEARRAGWGMGHRNSTTLTVDALDDAAMDALLEGLVPGMPAVAKTAVAARAEGVPLYAVETVRMLIDRDVVQPVDGVYRLVGDVGELAVPATLQSLLAARLDALEPDARRLVADAAVLGGTFPAEALVAVSDQSEGQVRRLLAELVRREVLGVRADPLSPQRGHYGFVQTMFRQVAYDTLSRRERKARHLAVAAHLRSAFADQGEEIAEVIAAHLLDALTAVPDDPDVPDLRSQAVTMLTRAGERAERTGAPATAATAYTTAADLLQHQATPDADLTAAGLLEQAGKAAGTAGDQATATTQYGRAADICRQHGRIREAARADAFVGHHLFRQGRFEDARAILENALAVLEPEPDEDTVTALDALAGLHAFAGNAVEAEQMTAAALAQAQALDLPDDVLSGLFTRRGIAHAMANRRAQSSANLHEAIRRAEAAHNSAATGAALLNLGEVEFTNDPAAAADTSRLAVAHCRHVGDRYRLGTAAGNLISALVLVGEWDEAWSVYMTGVHEDRLGGDVLFDFIGVLLSAFAGHETELAALLPRIQRSADSEDPQDLSAIALALAAEAMYHGRHIEALSHAKRSLTHGQVYGPSHESIRWVWPIAADAALALGEHTEVRRLLEWLDAYPPGHIPPVLRAERLRIRARLLAIENNPEAGSAFDAAIKAFRDFGSPYHLATALLDHADYLADGADPGRAQEVAAEANAIAEQLGAQPLMERGRPLTDAAESRPQPQPSEIGLDA